MTDRIAPEGAIYVCGACGKRSRDLYGEGGGWDESCMLNAVLRNEKTGAVIEDTRRRPSRPPRFEDILNSPVDPELLEAARTLRLTSEGKDRG